MQTTQHVIDTSHGKLNFARIRNDKPTLVLLHGAAGSWQSWMPVLPQLSARFDIIAPDLPGHGKSMRNDQSYAITSMAEPVIELVRQLDLKKFTLLGFSYGAHVALEMTGELADNINRLILHELPVLAQNDVLQPRQAGPNFHEWRDLILDHGANLEALHAVLATENSGKTPEELTFRAQALSELDLEFLNQICAGTAMASFKPHERFKALKVPTLLIRGDPDFGARFEPNEGQIAASLNTHVTDRQINNAGHIVHLDQPEDFITTLFDWLDDHPI